jgi:hypothetical protein
MQKNVKGHAGHVDLAKHALRELAERVPTVRVAGDTGIHQSQVSRLFRGHFKRISPNVRALLAYAKEPARHALARKPGEAGKAAVIKAALRTWDTTPEGAQALVRLLRSVQRIRRLANSK